MKKLLVVSSAYNEEENIEDFVYEIKSNYDKFKNNYKFPIDLELIVANNNSEDKTLEKLIKLKKKFSFLRVFNNNLNYGGDISLLNILKNNCGDFNLLLCSDLEDPPKLGFQMLNDLILNKDLDACVACKRDEKFILFKILRFIYYILTSFSTRTSLVMGFHGFGAYRSSVIKNSIIYAQKVYPDTRKSLLWSIRNFKKYSYKKGGRMKGISSYSLKSYFQEGINQLRNAPLLSSRISIRVTFFVILILFFLMIFYLINFFMKFFVFPGGITTILIIILFTSTLNYFLFALNAIQIEKIVLPNPLEIASSEEIK